MVADEVGPARHELQDYVNDVHRNGPPLPPAEWGEASRKSTPKYRGGVCQLRNKSGDSLCLRRLPTANVILVDAVESEITHRPVRSREWPPFHEDLASVVFEEPVHVGIAAQRIVHTADEVDKIKFFPMRRHGMETMQSALNDAKLPPASILPSHELPLPAISQGALEGSADTGTVQMNEEMRASTLQACDQTCELLWLLVS